jgi:putative ABC transport system permease protein
MNLRTIALKNLIRRKGKMALVVLGLSLAVATLVSVVLIIQGFRGAVDEQLNEYGFNIVISPKSKQIVLEYGGMTVGAVSSYQAPALTQADVDTVSAAAEARGGLRGLSPKLLEIAEANGKRVVLAGADLSAERGIKKWWLIEAGRYPEAADEIFVGEIAAEKLELELGDRLVVTGSGPEAWRHELVVAGILMETGSQDDNLVFVDLKQLQTITGKTDQLSLIEVAAMAPEDVEPLVAAVSKELPGAAVQSVKQAVEFKESALGHLFQFGLGITVIVVLISAMIVFTMMASSVNERRAEIGIFRAVGFRQRKVATIILTEAFVLGIIGGIVGYGLGLGLAQLLPLINADIRAIGPDPLLFAGALAMAIVIGIVASLIPAWRAANLDPIESLKSL